MKKDGYGLSTSHVFFLIFCSYECVIIIWTIADQIKKKV